MTLLDTLATDFIGLLGIASALIGLVFLLRPPSRSERAQQRQRKSLRYDPLLADAQLDEQSLFRVERYRNKVLGIYLFGMGGGFVIGVSCQLLFVHNIATAQAQSWSIQQLLVGFVQIGALIGITLVYLIAVLCWRTKPNNTLPPAFTDLNTYRRPWIVLAGAATFAIYALVSTLVTLGVFASSPTAYTLGQMALFWLWPIVAGIIVFAPEGLMLFAMRHPLWPADLDPILALKAQAVSFRALAMASWGFLPYFALTQLAFGWPPFVLNGSPVYSFIVAPVIAIGGVFWLAIAVYQGLFVQIHSVARLRAAVTQLADDTDNTQAQPIA